jgi:hypothetical protein
LKFAKWLDGADAFFLYGSTNESLEYVAFLKRPMEFTSEVTIAEDAAPEIAALLASDIKAQGKRFVIMANEPGSTPKLAESASIKHIAGENSDTS